MTGAAARVRRTQAALAGAVLLGAVVWALAIALVVLLGAGLADVVVGLSRPLRELFRAFAAVGGVAAAAVVAWRGRRVRVPGRVALWIEERHPALRYALVTATDARYAGQPAIERAVAGVRWDDAVRTAALRAVVSPLALAAVAGAALLLLPPVALSRLTTPRVGDVLDAPRGRSAGLGPLVVTITAPAYAGGTRRVVENPVAVGGLVGSTVLVEGRGAGGSGGDSALGAPHSALGVAVDDSAVVVTHRGDRWTAALPMPARPGLLRVAGRGEERLIALEPVPDSAPVVTLIAPARDSVFRAPAGAVSLVAGARDDLGLRDGWLEVIVSSGSGESFAFRTARFGARSATGRRDTITATMRLDTMRLRPGDLLHVRAVARDRNDVSGPGVGVSETRTIRVARRDEYDSTAVIALPPLPADSALLSQRMLILLTEELLAAVPQLARDTVITESRSVGRDQARLRRRVAEILFMRLGGEEGEHAHGEEGDEAEGAGDLTPEALLRAAESAVEEGIGEALDFHGDETPVIAINRPLLEAYNAMWDAGRELGVGEPARALPHMYAALEAIQRARTAERIYLRGRPPRVVVDLARVRLVGDARGAEPAGRTGGPADRRTVLARRFDAMLEAVGAAAALADSLLVLRVAALDVDDVLAAAFGEAAARVRSGRDATDALVRVRRLLGPPVRRSAGLPAWTTGWEP